MGISAKITMNVMLKSETEALEVLNKSNNDEFDDIKISGMTENNTDCCNVIVKNIYVDRDGIEEEVYSTNEINYTLIRSIKKHIDIDDIVCIKGITYFILLLPDNKLNLYAMKERKYYFDNNLSSIEEINNKFKEDNVIYELYVVR